MNPLDTNCLLSGQPAKIIKRNISQVHNFSTEDFITSKSYDIKSNEYFELTEDQIKRENLCRRITK